MSWRGMFLKAGIETDGQNISAIRGLITARSAAVPVGNVYFVDKRLSTTGHGKSWNRAFTTVEEAFAVMRARVDWAIAPWAMNDICFIGPGTYAENLTAMPHGCTIIGAGPDLRDAQVGTKISPASGSPVNVGGFVNAHLINLCFESQDTSAAFDSEVLNNVTFEECRFSGPAETSTTVAGIVSLDAVGNRLIKCELSCLDKGIDINYADGGDSFSHNLIIDTIFDQIDTAGIEISTNLVGPSSKVIRCFFFGGGVTMSYAIHDNVAILDVAACFAESTSGFSGCRSVNGSYNNGVLIT